MRKTNPKSLANTIARIGELGAIARGMAGYKQSDQGKGRDVYQGEGGR